MAILYNLYSDPQCSNPAKSGKMGALYLNETLRNKANWNKSVAEIPPQFVGGKTGLHFYTHYGILRGMASTSPNTAWWSLNRVYGGYGLFSPNYTINDDKTQSDTTKVPNAFFISKHDGVGPTQETFDGSCVVLQVYSSLTFDAVEGHANGVGVDIIEYGQSPSPSDGTRTQWDYFTENAQKLYSFDVSQKNDSLYTNIGFAKITLPWGTDGENINFVAVVGNYDDNGEFQPTNTGYTGCIMLFPEELWTDSTVIPPPYVGPVSKDSAEGFTPPTGAEGDNIGSRDLTGKLNPYGFNTGNGLILANLGYADYCDIVKQIYTGISGNPIDGLSQIVSGAVGGNSHRPADELNTMISAVLCCHVIPEIGTGATGGTHSMKTLAGYKLYDGSGKSITTTTQTILSAESGHYQIAPVVNNFLLFEPFCSFSLSLPFVGDIQIPPSLIWTLTANHEAIGNYLYFVERLDMFTGVFSVDVHIINAVTGKDILYTTRQTNCAVDLPVMGTGATGNPLQKIASAAGNIASGFAGVPAAAGDMINAVGTVHSGSVCGRVGSPNLAAYVATRERYAVITWADSAAPENYFDVAGGVRHGAGTVGSYRGYTEFENVDLSGLHGATDAEKQEIERILTGGVFL